MRVLARFYISLVTTAHAIVLPNGEGATSGSYTENAVTSSGFEKVGAERAFAGAVQSDHDPVPQTKRDLDVLGNNRREDNWVNPPTADGNYTLICNDPGLNTDTVNKRLLQDGISYLSKLMDTNVCALGPPVDGKSQCAKLSCSYNAAIWWCNDNNHEVAWPCNTFAKFAQKIITQDGCLLSGDGGEKEWVKGQLFDLDYKVNVYFANDKC